MVGASSGPSRPHLRLGIGVEPHRLDDGVVEFLDRHVLARREVIGALPGAVGRLEHRARQVLDEAEVAPRRGDEALLALRQTLEEDRQRAGDVARADHVGEPEGHVVDARDLQVVLGHRLGDRVAGVDRIARDDRAGSAAAAA